MKKIYLSLFLILIACCSHAQITLTGSDMPPVGWTDTIAVDSHPQNINFGNSGPNQIYDFSTLHQDATDVIYYDSLTAAQSLIEPNANFYIRAFYFNPFYAKIDSAGYGLVALHTTLAKLDTTFTFSTPIEQYRFPVTYATGYSGFSASTTTAWGTRFDSSYGAVTMRVRIRTGYRDTVDGWGKLILPGCSYNCLRVKRMRIDTIYTDQKTTLVAYQNISSSITQEVEYYYLTKEAKGSALTFNYDVNGNVSKVLWSLGPAYVSPPFFTDSNIIGGAVAFIDTAQITSLTIHSWDFGDSSLPSTVQDPVHVYHANGNYQVCLTHSQCQHSYTYCDTVRVTELVADSNYAPVAVNDSANLIQGNSIVIFPLFNDFDPNGDSLCIDTVWNALHGSITVSNCSQITYNNTDTNFIGADTVYYKVCDNDSVPLCDTARIVINVLPQLPIAIIGRTNGNLAFFCDWGYLRDSSLYYNLDSPIIWSLKIVNQWSGGAGDSIILYGNNSIRSYPSGLPYTWGHPAIYVCLTVKNKFGSSTSCDSFNVDCEAVNDIKLSDFKIYPNPANDKIVVAFSKMDNGDLKDISSIEVYDILGKKLKEVAISENSLSISVSDLKNGIYVIDAIDKDHYRKVLGKFEIIR